MKKSIILLFVIVLFGLMTHSNKSISQTIYHSIKVSNIDFNKGQQDTLIYIFVEHEFLKKQYETHKKQINELEELINTYKIKNIEYIDKFDKLVKNNENLQYNNNILQRNLDKTRDKLNKMYYISAGTVAVLTVLLLLK